MGKHLCKGGRGGGGIAYKCNLVCLPFYRRENKTSGGPQRKGDKKNQERIKAAIYISVSYVNKGVHYCKNVEKNLS